MSFASQTKQQTPICKKYILDFKQAAAFEIMACSFILSSLNIEKISEEDIHHFFEENEEDSLKYTKFLKGFKTTMKDKGGVEELVMFLSGMGGTGKSEVIKAFVEFAKGISFVFGWNFDKDVVKITALTGTAACGIPNGRTLHSQVCLSGNKVSQKL